MTAAGTRVLHIVNGEFYAGAERVQDLLALQLVGEGFDVSFVCLKDGVFAARRASRGAPLYSMPMRSRFDIGLARRVATLIRRERFALVHTHTPRAALVGRLASWLAGVPMVHHVHSPAESDTEARWRNVRNSFVEKLSLLGVRKLIPVSASLERYLRARGYKSDRIAQVANGVPGRPETRREYRPGEELTVGTVALFRPRKGIEVLLRAIARLHDAGMAVSLHAVGPFETPAYEAEVRAETERLGLSDAVRWTGFTDDVTAEFAHMHVFALPSLFGEGMPMVVLEAMAAGLPIVSTRVEGIPEVVRDGREGLLCEPDDATGLAAALQRFIDGHVDARALGRAGRDRHRKHFSDAAMAAGVATVYREVLA